MTKNKWFLFPILGCSSAFLSFVAVCITAGSFHVFWQTMDEKGLLFVRLLVFDMVPIPVLLFDAWRGKWKNKSWMCASVSFFTNLTIAMVAMFFASISVLSLLLMKWDFCSLRL